MKLTSIICAALLTAPVAALDAAGLKLAALFSDHRVLQGDMPVPVWGWADPGQEVCVSIAGQTKSAIADASGKWSVTLDKMKPGTSATMTVKGMNTITINDVVVGEVWLGSGQSNMAMRVSGANDFQEEQKAANFPGIRMFKEESASATTRQTVGAGRWVICAPDTVGAFSATLYFFGRAGGNNMSGFWRRGGVCKTAKARDDQHGTSATSVGRWSSHNEVR